MHARAHTHSHTHLSQSTAGFSCAIFLAGSLTSCHKEHSPTTGSTPWAPGCSSALSKPLPLSHALHSFPPLLMTMSRLLLACSASSHSSSSQSLFTGILLTSTLATCTHTPLHPAPPVPCAHLGKLSLHIHVCMPTSPLTQCSPLCAPHQPSAHTEYGCPSFLANIQLSPPTAGGSSKGSSRPLGLRSQFPARQLGEGTLSKAPLPGLRQSWPQSKTYWLPPPTRGPTCHPCLPRNRTGTGKSSGKSPGGGQEAALNLRGHRRLIEPIP